MRKSKLERFAEMDTFTNVIQPVFDDISQSDYYLKGKWAEEWFGDKNAIVLELGCGKGEYTLGLAGHNPEKNFIGIDIKGARIWRGAKAALEKGLKNVAFLRTRIGFIESFFAKNEVDEIWITFPDPQPQNGRAKKRLTHPNYLKCYQTFLKKEGIIHLKTDNEQLYKYTLEVIGEGRHELFFSTNDLYDKVSSNGMDSSLPDVQVREAAAIQTFYEQKFLDEGKKICYLKFRLL